MTRQELAAQAGAKLRKIRVRLGLSIREVERRSQQLVQQRQNRDFFLSRAWITDIEKGRFIPGLFKIVSLGVLYQMSVAEIHALFGIAPGDIAKERALFGAPKTHLLSSPDESVSDSVAPPAGSDVSVQLENTNLLTRLVDIWGDIPVPHLRRLELRRSLYGYIGTKDLTMQPLIPPGSFVQIDTKQTKVKKKAVEGNSGQSLFERPIYFLDLRDGYACGWCEIESGELTLIPHPDSPEKTRRFRYPSEVEIVGRVTGVAMRIAEGNVAILQESLGQRNPPKK
jgi:transcriptional regulator with XRE-family HTH domain